MEYFKNRRHRIRTGKSKCQKMFYLLSLFAESAIIPKAGLAALSSTKYMSLLMI